MFTTIQQVVGIANKSGDAQNVDSHTEQKWKNFRGNKKATKEDSGQTVYDYEQNIISVQSALLFLEGFLETRLEGIFPEKRLGKHEDLAPWLTSKNSNQNSTFASRAYKHAAEISSKFYNPVGSTKLKKSRELTSVYHLIQELRGLLSNGVEYLKIESGIGFLDAIDASVAKLKSEI